jgi:hypothetical protein
MNKLVVSGIPSLDGTYEFEDFATFTNRELHRIKMMTGLRVGEFQEAFEVGDNDVLVALAMVVLTRTGKEVDDDLLWDAPAGVLVFDFSEEADPTQGSGTPSEPSESESDESEQSATGNGGQTPSESPESDRSLTGLPGLPKSVIYDPETLAS